jgi:lysyl oxidase
MESGLAVSSAREIFGRARRLAPLVALAALFALPSAASAGGGQPLLPDLIQVPPPTTSIQVGKDTDTGEWAITFASIVGNVGAGPLEIQGFGPGAPTDMTAYQMIYHEGSSTPVQSTDPVGHVHYDYDTSHNHWHFQPLDQYQLRSLDGSHVYSDQKEGFCLVNFPPLPAGTPTVGPAGQESDYNIGVQGQPGYFCSQGDPTATSIREGISVGWSDEYTGIRSGTDVLLTGVPAGRYDLVQQVNSTQALQELDYTNNAWSAVVDISYPNGPDGEPTAAVRATCPGVATCSYTDPPGPPPPADPGPDKTAPKLLLGGATRQRFLRGRAIYVYVKCDEVCTVKASGRIAALQVASALRTASTKLTLKPGVRTKIRLPITARTRAIINRQLRRGARVVVRVSLTATDTSGNRSSGTRTLTLLRNR